MKAKWDDWILPGLVIIMAVATFVFIAFAMLTDNPVAAQPAPFDHSQCQYPNRQSNPIDGCDNTDPALAECMKLGTEGCSLPKTNEVQPISVPSVAPAASHAVVSEPTPVKRGCYE